MENCQEMLKNYLEAQKNVKRPKRLREDHIEDEDQSVRWNRDFVKNYNEEQENTYITQMRAQADAWKSYQDTVKNYIMTELNCSMCDSVWELMEFVSHYCGGDGLYDELGYLEELVDIIKNIKFEKKED